MKTLHAVLAALALNALTFAPLPALADDDQPNVFVRMCEASPDGKVTKAQVMATVEKAFDKHDTKKEGKLDKKQAQNFVKEFTRESGG